MKLEWDKIEYELTRERGLWGRTSSDSLVKWSLYLAEGPLRMRKRMIQNHGFYMRYPYVPKCLLQFIKNTDETKFTNDLKIEPFRYVDSILSQRSSNYYVN